MERMRVVGAWAAVTVVGMVWTGCGGGTTNRCLSGEISETECRQICADYAPDERPDWCAGFLGDASAPDGSRPDGSQPDGGRSDGGSEGGMDGSAGDGCATRTWYRDRDGDGYGAAGDAMEGCEAPSGYVDNSDDCNDDPMMGGADVHPGASEACNEVDDDCDGETDEDFSDLGDGCTVGTGACEASGTMVCAADGSGTECDATEGSPSSEACNGIDDDCDGETDEDPAASNACMADEVCADGACACVPSLRTVRGFDLLRPGETYTVCGSCLSEVDQVRLGGRTLTPMPGSGCRDGEDALRFTVPGSGVGGPVQLQVQVGSDTRRRSNALDVFVGTPRLNEVDVRTGSGASINRAQFIEVCAVAPDGTAMGGVPLRGYAVRAYADDGSLDPTRKNWPLSGTQTAPSGCLLLGHASVQPMGWPANAWVGFPNTANVLLSPGGITIETGPTRADASAAQSQVVDAVVYNAYVDAHIANLRVLLNAGATPDDAPTDTSGTDSMPRCGDALRDNRAWRRMPTEPTPGNPNNNCR